MINDKPYLPQKPRVRTWDVLRWLQKDYSESGDEFTKDDIQTQFNMKDRDAYTRIQKLHAWGMIKRSIHDRKRMRGIYVLTDYGKRFIIPNPE